MSIFIVDFATSSRCRVKEPSRGLKWEDGGDEEGKGEVEKVNREGPILPSLIIDFSRSKLPLLCLTPTRHLITTNLNRRCQSHRSFTCKYSTVRAVVSASIFMPNKLPSGVAGGFAPPDPAAAKSVSCAAQTNTLKIVSSSSNLAPADVERDGSADALLEELQSILKTIPTEDPRGSEDIYGLGISIMWGSKDLEWQNLCPQGCGGASTVQATDEHKAKFKKALEIADALVAKGIGS